MLLPTPTNLLCYINVVKFLNEIFLFPVHSAKYCKAYSTYKPSLDWLTYFIKPVNHVSNRKNASTKNLKTLLNIIKSKTMVCRCCTKIQANLFEVLWIPNQIGVGCFTMKRIGTSFIINQNVVVLYYYTCMLPNNTNSLNCGVVTTSGLLCQSYSTPNIKVTKPLSVK